MSCRVISPSISFLSSFLFSSYLLRSAECQWIPETAFLSLLSTSLSRKLMPRIERRVPAHFFLPYRTFIFSLLPLSLLCPPKVFVCLFICLHFLRIVPFRLPEEGKHKHRAGKLLSGATPVSAQRGTSARNDDSKWIRRQTQDWIRCHLSSSSPAVVIVVHLCPLAI